jgi:hypothetical protein
MWDRRNNGNEGNNKIIENDITATCNKWNKNGGSELILRPHKLNVQIGSQEERSNWKETYMK